MWNAIKSDLVSFVSTVREDAVKVVTSVIGDEEEDQNEDQKAHMQRRIFDMTRDYKTYADVMEETLKRDFHRFMHKFSLPSKAGTPCLLIVKLAVVI